MSGMSGGTFAGFGTSSSTMVFRDYGYGLVGMNVINEDSASVEHLGLMLSWINAAGLVQEVGNGVEDSNVKWSLLP